MVTKFVVAVALFAVCSSSPVLIDDVLYRDGRSYSIGQAYTYNDGSSVALANANGDNAQAYGSATGNNLARDGLVYPEQAIAQAQIFGEQGNPGYGDAKAVAQAHNGGYYPIPAPATVITYEQNFAVPAQVGYELPGGIHAHSSAVRNGASDSSITSATSNGAGVAESSANTGAGSYGITSSNSKTYGGYGHADSKANSGYNSASTSARTQGQGSASSAAQTNGPVGVYNVVPATPIVVPSQELLPAVVDVKTPIIHRTYVPVAPAEVASANANVVGSGNAASSAKINHGKTISWRFGTLYDNPAPGSALAQVRTQGQGNANAQANSNGYGAARAGADVNSGLSSAKSTANVNGAGSADAIADINAPGHGVAKSTANTHYGSATSTANTGAYGQAKSAANVNGGYYGGSRTSANAQSQGYGSASSSARAQPVSTAFRVANSQANSSGSGYALANAQTA